MKLIGVIPARYASTRMPGKPLADVLGKPMIWWVYKAAKACPKLDDVLNYIPSRLTALLMILSAGILRLDMKNAWRIWRRDRRNHASPNSAQTEAVCAGALDVRLAGDAYYFGELHKKPFIGDNIREIENEDIRRTNRLMYCTSALMLILCTAVRALLWGIIL